MREIIYGVGQAIFEPFTAGAGGILALAKLKDVNITSTYTMEDVTGGNAMFPLASFPKDKAVKVSATNSLFEKGLLTYQEGFTTAGTADKMTEIQEFLVPVGASAILAHAAVTDSVRIPGFTVVTVAPSAVNTFQVTTVATVTTLTFFAADVGDLVQVIYDYTGEVGTVTYQAFETSMQKPFKFTYVFDVYDENNKVVAKGNLKIHKALMSAGVSFDFAHQTAYAQKIEFDAKDPQRLDKMLWSFSTSPVA